MAKEVGICINGVIRDYLTALDKKYRQVFDMEPNYPYNIENLDETFPIEEIDRGDSLSFDLNFEADFQWDENLQDYVPQNKPETLKSNDQSQREEQRSIYYFMYFESPLPIFARAPYTEKFVINTIGELERNIQDRITLVSKESQMTKNATLMFLCADSQFDNDNIKFVNSVEEYWEPFDILITENPVILNKKPSDKTAIKYNTSYNKNVPADFEINSVSDLFENPTKYFSVND
jgi:hypothetical protein